ncbi:MAG TPA: rhodanese-like domain-containing protein [Micromonosporaceae bacterium]|nr:rhodanese-like domain-containing protein [Micromonosporaceae bacterium]
MTNSVLRVPYPPAAEAAAHFAATLGFETDVSDVHGALEAGRPGFVLLDVRGRTGWDAGHVPQARHLPTDEIPSRARRELDVDVPLVTYCWGPGCNGATRAALLLAREGFRVKTMIGGMEYWIREGLQVRTAAGVVRMPADPLTVPGDLTGCAC